MIFSYAGLLLAMSVDAVVSGVTIEPRTAEATEVVDVNRRHVHHNINEPIIIPSIQDEKYRPAESWIQDGNLSWDEYSDRIRFRMTKGRLSPQIKELASHLSGAEVDDTGEWFQWGVSPNFQWPNNVTLEERSVEHLIDLLMLSYGLNINIARNGVVLVHE